MNFWFKLTSSIKYFEVALTAKRICVGGQPSQFELGSLCWHSSWMVPPHPDSVSTRLFFELLGQFLNSPLSLIGVRDDNIVRGPCLNC